MESLLAARDEALKKGWTSVARRTTASTRTFDDTVRLWNSRFLPALITVADGKITKKERMQPDNRQYRNK